VALARLFDAPPLKADPVGLLRLAVLFERHDPPGGEYVDLPDKPVRWSWTANPQLWLIPLTPPDDERLELECELERYFTEDGKFDEDGFWWFAACGIYPAVRWDLTVYLGLKLTSPDAAGRPLYSDARALRLAVLPWFRDGYMPPWLRMRLIQSLPTIFRSKAVALLRDIFDRAVAPDEKAFEAVRLRIAQERADVPAGRPERDEIFLDALAAVDPLAFEVRRNVRELIGGTANEFVRREWMTFALIVLYWAAVVFMVPLPSAGALTTREWLPFAFLPLAFATLPAARRLSRWVRKRSERIRPAGGGARN
jgi:hypothetical protein